MEWNTWGLELYHQHYGDEATHESHRGHDAHAANQPSNHPGELSQLTGHLGNLGIGRGENHAQSAPRTARVGGTDAFDAPSSRAQFPGAHYQRISTFHMDASPPGDIPVYEAPDSPLRGQVISAHPAPPAADTTERAPRQAGASGSRDGIIGNLGRRLGLFGSSSNRTAQASAAPDAQIDAAEQQPAHYAQIMGLLPDYARGVRIATLQQRVGPGCRLKKYLTSQGGLAPRGAVFRSLLSAAEQERLDAAIVARRAALADEATVALIEQQYRLSQRPAHYEHIMDETFLADLARGVRISDLDKLSGGSFARGYFKSDGTLLTPATIFRNHLDQPDRARFDRACAARVVVTQAFARISSAGFSKVAKYLAAGEDSLDAAAAHAGVAVDDLRMFLTEEGLTPSVARLATAGRTASARIMRDVNQWLQRRAGHGAPEQRQGASPSDSFFEISMPGQDYAVANPEVHAYEQDAIWRSLSDQNAPDHPAASAAAAPAFPAPQVLGGSVGASSSRTARPPAAPRVRGAPRAPGVARLPAHHAQIMALLPDYASGAAIPVIQRRIGNAFDFGVYFTPNGGLRPHGIAFRNGLGAADQERLDVAIVGRQAALSDEAVAAAAKQQHFMLRRPANYDDIMNEDFLASFARGARLLHLERRPGNACRVRDYFKTDGTLAKGGVIFRNHLDPADQARFDRACSDRSATVQAYNRIGRYGFREVAQALAAGGRTLEAAAAHAGVAVRDLHVFLTDDGLTPAGRACLDAREAAIWAPLLENPERRQQQRQPQRRRTPEAREHGSPSSSFFSFPVPGQDTAGTRSSWEVVEQQAIWDSLSRPNETNAPAGHVSPSTSFFDFPTPGQESTGTGVSWQPYAPDVLWDALSGQSAPGRPHAHSAGAGSSSRQADPEWEANMAAQAARLGIPFFGEDDVGPEWRGATFAAPHGQPVAYASDRLAGRLATLLHAGEIESGDLVNVRGVNYRLSPIGGRPAPTPDNPHGLAFALYPI